MLLLIQRFPYLESIFHFICLFSQCLLSFLSFPTLFFVFFSLFLLSFPTLFFVFSLFVFCFHCTYSDASDIISSSLNTLHWPGKPRFCPGWIWTRLSEPVNASSSIAFLGSNSFSTLLSSHISSSMNSSLLIFQPIFIDKKLLHRLRARSDASVQKTPNKMRHFCVDQKMGRGRCGGQDESTCIAYTFASIFYRLQIGCLHRVSNGLDYLMALAKT